MKIGQDEHGWGTRPLITQLSEDLLEKIIRYYHSKGVRSTIHISNEHNAIEAIYAGVDTLAHPVIQSPVSAAFLNLMRTKRVPMASTLTIGESYSRLADHPEYLDQPLYRDTMDAAEIQRLKTVESPRQREDRWAQWMKVMTPVGAGQPQAAECRRQGHRRARHGPIVGRGRPSRARTAGRRRHHAGRRDRDRDAQLGALPRPAR